MNKNRIRGLQWRAKRQVTTKSMSIKLKEICGMSQNVAEVEAIPFDRAAGVS